MQTMQENMAMMRTTSKPMQRVGGQGDSMAMGEKK